MTRMRNIINIIVILIRILFFNNLIIFLDFIYNNVINKDNDRLINDLEFLEGFLKKSVRVFINIATFYVDYDVDSKVEIINVFDFLFNEKKMLILFFF